MTNVTRPFLPPLEDVTLLLEQIWDSRVLSNGGPLHHALEEALQEMLGVAHVSLFCNATIALMVAQKVLGVDGEVVTTPYSFAATAHAIHWVGNRPVFCDVEPNALTLDPSRLEALVSKNTAAVMPLHCYGNTCDVIAIQEVASRYEIPVIYDACHSFGVNDAGGSVLRHGDIAVVSLHATKVFHTFEGGLLVTHSRELKERVDRLKNFGFLDETSVTDVGINGKMSEFNAAVGLAQLQYYGRCVDRRADLDKLYREMLESVDGIVCQLPCRQTQRNYAYFPIFVQETFGLTRDELYQSLKAQDVHCRRYFYPLISEFPAYCDYASSAQENLPVATLASREVICLPMYADLTSHEVMRICEIIAAVTR